MVFRRLALVLALSLATPARAGDPPPAAAVAGDEAHQAELLGYARTLIVQGQPQDAITRYLNPVLAHYGAAYARETRQLYGSRGPAETLFYMLQAALNNKSAVAIPPTWGEALFTKGFALVDLGRHDEARLLFEKAVALSPMNSQYLAELGNIHQHAKDWPKALATFQQAVAAAEFSPDADKTTETTRALRGMGFSLTELGRYNESEAAYRKCLALDPRDRAAAGELKYIAELRAKAGKPGPTT